jgi:hypothetical protein
MVDSVSYVIDFGTAALEEVVVLVVLLALFWLEE